MKKKISVIIPFYSNKNWLEESIESVFNQTYKNFEIIIINDGSEEDISDFKSKYSSQLIIINQKNKGAANARNHGIEISNGDYIAFLDSDDLWLPDKLEKQINFMEENNFKWSHSDYLRFWDNIKHKEVLVKCNFEGNIIPKCLISNPIATPCVMIDKCLFLENKYFRFSEDKKIGEDSYLWQQIGEKFELGYLPDALTKVRIRGTNAAFQAHLQLKYRGESISTLKKYKNNFSSQFVYQCFLFVLIYCNIMTKIILNISSKLNLQNSSIEIIYKFFYVFPFISFRLIRKLL
jgi:glycosyltransferase involved in cell wall biosynthesis